jgi:hypothetical protein
MVVMTFRKKLIAKKHRKMAAKIEAKRKAAKPPVTAGRPAAVPPRA